MQLAHCVKKHAIRDLLNDTGVMASHKCTAFMLQLAMPQNIDQPEDTITLAHDIKQHTPVTNLVNTDS